MSAFTLNEAPNEVPVEQEQFNQIALDPQRSVVVEACAGSGKTWLLVARIMRLLLAGARPAEILALTFTRKAAQEMRDRLLRLLEQLATADDGAAHALLTERGLDAATARELLPRARGLLEVVLTASAPMVIDTFHGWFGRIVRSAPLFAGIPASLTTSERTGELYREARRAFLNRVTRDANLQAHYLELLRLADNNAPALLRKIWLRRNEWRSVLEVSDIEAVLQHLVDELQIEDAPEDPRLSLLQDAGFSQSLSALLRMLGQGSETEKKRTEAAEAGLRQLLDQGFDEDAFLDVLHLVKQKSKDERYKLNASSKKAAQAEWGAAGEARLEALVDTVFERLSLAVQTLVEHRVFELNRAALYCGAALIEAYDEAKEASATLDFDDLEWHAAALTRSNETAAYIQTRLDARYKHVLIDEFQDTNPLQWSVLRHWLAAYGADTARPSVFLVGDPKQSIYRFRRAEPRIFAAASTFLQQQYGADVLRTNLTRRCAGTIVDALNAALVSDEYPLYAEHQTASTAQGSVWRLPLVPYPMKEKRAADISDLTMRDALTTPLEEIEHTQGEQEAAQIVQALQRLIGLRHVIGDDGQPRLAEYRDVLLLVRKRSRINALETALRAANMPCISDRRGGLLDTLEALDLAALLNFLITPFADLTLAHVLRTPIFGCSNAALIALAQRHRQRRAHTIKVDTEFDVETSLWACLHSLSEADVDNTVWSTLIAARQQLSHWLTLAGILPVHDLLDHIYHQGRVIERYVASVPAAQRIQVRANLLACMELALELDSGRYPSLPRFIEELNTLSNADEQESPGEGLTAQGNAVRILTVHGAKGLEAPIVVLVDARNANARGEAWSVLIDWPPEAERPDHFSVYGSNNDRGQARAPRFDLEAALSQREDWNLLYVAATRAREVLLISGVAPYRENKQAVSWYERLQDAPEFDWTLPWQSLALTEQASSDVAERIIVEDFQPSALRIGEREIRLDDTANDEHDQANTTRDQHQRLRGIALHAVLEHQTGQAFDTAQAMQIAKIWLASNEAENIVMAASQMLAAPHLRRFFDPALYQRADNELELLTAEGELMRIDRLVEFGTEHGNEIWVLDYKLQTFASMPEQYRLQLERYQLAVRSLYPQRRVRAALISAQGNLLE